MGSTGSRGSSVLGECPERFTATHGDSRSVGKVIRGLFTPAKHPVCAVGVRTQNHIVRSSTQCLHSVLVRSCCVA